MKGATGSEPLSRILLAEDEPELAGWLVKALEQGGFRVDWVADGRLVRPSLEASVYDALILDLGLPGLNGHDVLADLRGADQRLPVLILTASDRLAERVSTLREGADDFLAKPFEIAELEARLFALIRRARGSDRPRFACGPLAWDPGARRFTLDGQTLALTPREQALLAALIQRTGEPMSKRDLLERVFAEASDAHPEAIEVIVHRLRKRLESSGARITTLRGLGYLLEST